LPDGRATSVFAKQAKIKPTVVKHSQNAMDMKHLTGKYKLYCNS